MQIQSILNPQFMFITHWNFHKKLKSEDQYFVKQMPNENFSNFFQ